MRKLYAVILSFLLILPCFPDGLDTVKATVRGQVMGQRKTTQEWRHNFPTGLTFYADYTRTVGTDATQLLAKWAKGSPKATYTCARSASAPATYVDANGVIQLVTTSNVPRYVGGYYDTTGFHSARGLLVEAGSTNLLKNSKFDTNSAWSVNNLQYSGTTYWIAEYANSGEATTTMSSNGITWDNQSPNIQVTNQGTTAVTDVLFRGSGTSNNFTIANTFKYSLTFHVWCDSSVTPTVETVQSSVRTVNTGLSSTFTTVANKWLKITLPFTGNANAAGDTSIIKFELGRIGTFNIRFDAIQIEGSGSTNAPVATSFIPTTTAALTRAGDVLTYPTALNRTAAQESIFVKFMPLGGSFANDGVARLLCDTSVKSRYLSKGSAATVVGFATNANDSGSSFKAASTNPLLNTSYVSTASACGPTASPNIRVYTNGVAEGTHDTNYTSPSWGANFFIGSNSSSLLQLNGLIQEVAFFNRALIDSEVKAVSTELNK